MSIPPSRFGDAAQTVRLGPELETRNLKRCSSHGMNPRMGDTRAAGDAVSKAGCTRGVLKA